MRDGAIAFVLDAGAAPARDDAIRARTLDEGIEQHHLQVAAVNGKLRIFITGETPGRFGINELAEAVEETIFARGDGDFRQRILQPERHHFLRRMRQQIDADADGFQLRRRFENPAGNSGAMQHQAER